MTTDRYTRRQPTTALKGALILACVFPAALAGQGSSQADNWYRCNTHTHSNVAEGDTAPEVVVQWYKAHGYQCLVLTEHEHWTAADAYNKRFGANPPFLVIGGQEIGQSVAGTGSAHVGAINTNKLILPLGTPPDYSPSGVSMAETYIRNINEVYAAGGIPQINHPGGVWGVHLEDLLPIQRPFLFEVWNGVPGVGNLGGEDEKGVVSPSFEALWDGLLSHGKTAWGVAADDAHTYTNFGDVDARTPGKAWIVVRAPQLTSKAVMDALRDGRFYSSTGVSLKDYQVDNRGISITIDPPRFWGTTEKMPVLYKTLFIGRDGKVLSEMVGLSPHYRFKGDEEYVRASIIDSDGRRAWTQPVFRAKPTAR